MFLARVTGLVVATQKVKSMTGHKLLTVEPLRVDPQQRDKLIGRIIVVGNVISEKDQDDRFDGRVCRGHRDTGEGHLRADETFIGATGTFEKKLFPRQGNGSFMGKNILIQAEATAADDQ